MTILIDIFSLTSYPQTTRSLEAAIEVLLIEVAAQSDHPDPTPLFNMTTLNLNVRIAVAFEPHLVRAAFQSFGVLQTQVSLVTVSVMLQWDSCKTVVY
jgi:hypothetical protein